MASEMPAKIIVDFTNVKESSGFNPVHQEPGDYRGVIKSVGFAPSKAGNDQFMFAIADVDRPSAVYRYACQLTENTLWKLRNLIVACGIDVPKKKVNVSSVVQRLVGKEVGISLDDNEYEGKVSSQIVSVFPSDELADPEEDTPPAAKKAAAKKKAAATEEDEEDVAEDVEDLDIDDL